jgi:hypothetical protein
MADLHLTKIAFGCANVAELRGWLEAHTPLGEARLTTRNLPTRHAELAGGSLYWIHTHTLVGRSPILGFEQREDGKWWIRLAPCLIDVAPRPRRAHQGWRYLAGSDAPADLGFDEEPLPPQLGAELARLGLI